MTTLTRSRRNDNVLIGFFVLVLAAIAARTAVADNAVAAVIFGALAIALVGLGLWLRTRPPVQMRIEGDQIVLASPKRQLGRISRYETGGTIVIQGVIRKGRLYTFLTGPGASPWSGQSLDGFDGDQVAEACTAHGWTVERNRA